MKRLILAILGGAIFSQGCQTLLGHEPFDFDPEAAGGGAGTEGQGGDAGASGVEGSACSDDSTCGALVCVLGACRIPCTDDQTCPKTSICLLDRTNQKLGCRLGGEVETKCGTDSPCSNTALTCGVDGSCRLPCSAENTCPGNGQYCIRGTCVSENEASWQTSWGLCAALLSGDQAKAQSGIFCKDKELTGCNLDQPGVFLLASCKTPEACQDAASKGNKNCPDACADGPYRCQGAELQQCKADQSGYEKLSTCASDPICLKSKDDKLGACLQPKCGPGGVDPQARCIKGDAEICDATQQTYETKDCSDLEQCNPANGACGAFFQIDPTEVTRKDYTAFLAKTPKPDKTKTIAACQWNDSYDADPTCVASNAGKIACVDGNNLATACSDYKDDLCSNGSPLPCDNFPQTCVDWCDAHDYCASLGKHLCGRLADPDVMAPFDTPADAGKSEWMNACSVGGDLAWVFGDENLVKCNTSQYWSKAAQPLPVQTLATCVSPLKAYAGVFDLTGNVAEWENSCEQPGSAEDLSGSVLCRTRGEGFDKDNQKNSCASTTPRARNTTAPTLGFRCCNSP